MKRLIILLLLVLAGSVVLSGCLDDPLVIQHQYEDDGEANVIIVWKTQDEIVNNSEVLQIDAELFFEVGANESWIVEWHLITYGEPTADILVEIKYPVAALIDGRLSYYDMNQINRLIRWNGEVFTLGCQLAPYSVAHYIATLTTESTTGVVALWWAQDSAEVSDTIVKAGSWFRATKVEMAVE